jgi:hypothetical protein
LPDSIPYRMEQIREFLNEPRLNGELRATRKRFNKVCAAMDIIEDAQVALEEYRDRGEKAVR